LQGLICHVGAHQRLFIKATHVARSDSGQGFIYVRVGGSASLISTADQRPQLIGKGISSL